MSAGGGSSQDFDINLAPIIDCFTVLVTFLLASSAFISIGLIEAGVSAGGVQQAGQKEPPPMALTVQLKPGHELEIRTAGKISRTILLASKESDYDYERLNTELAGLKKQFPTVEGATLLGSESVEYGDVVGGMEQIRRVYPAVLLGGF